MRDHEVDVVSPAHLASSIMHPLGAAHDYEDAYLRDVLGLDEGMKEEEIDDKLAREARQFGIEIDVGMKQRQPQRSQRPSEENVVDTRPLSMPVIAARRTSVDSRRSVAASSASSLAASRASLSFRDYDHFLARGRREGRGSMSFSPPKTPSASTSVFSLPLSSPESSPKKHYRLMRGLNLLRLNRMDAGIGTRGCPHCPRDAFSQRRAVHKLPCGHRLCTKALRDTITTAMIEGTGAIPSCCGIPIPGCLVEHVMTQQEQAAVLDKLDSWSRGGSTTPSIKSEQRPRRPHALTSASRTVSLESKVDSVAPESKSRCRVDESRPEIRRLRSEQQQLEARFSVWIEEKRADMATRHETWRRDIRSCHEAAIERLEAEHAHAMAEAEDKQVAAEADLRAAHAQEERDTATALRHMEAYCAGNYVSTGQPHGRRVTEQDLAELENARRAKEGQRQRHDSAINVLRGEQARRLRLREQRQDRAVADLRGRLSGVEAEGERGWEEERSAFEAFVSGRWAVLKGRWEVEGRVVERREHADYDERLDEGTEEPGWTDGARQEQAVDGAGR